jgi:hypothetical protein
VFRPIEIFLIPFSLLWGGFAVVWNAGVWKTDADLSFKLFGLPFLIAGLYVTVGRFLIDMLVRRATTYFVTNKRVLIARGSKLKSLDIKRCPLWSWTSELMDGERYDLVRRPGCSVERTTLACGNLCSIPRHNSSAYRTPAHCTI